MLNPNVVRWLKSSIVTYFNSKLFTMNFWVENEDRNIQNLQNNVQFRMEGPYVCEYTKNFYEITLTINLLVTRAIDKKDLYGIEADLGKVANAFATNIPIYKYGATLDDDQTLIDCIIRQNDLRVMNFGQVNVDVLVLQSAVDADYKMLYDQNEN